MTDINQLVELLIEYGIKEEFFTSKDKVYMRNRLCTFLRIEAYSPTDIASKACDNIGHLLSDITKWAFDNGHIESVKMPYSDLFETALMDILVPKPSQVSEKFWHLYKAHSKKATEWYFNFSKATDYIKTNNIANNMVWSHQTPYGEMAITINLSKPEKDPKAIAEAAKMKQSNYPKCLLCKENVGFSGHLNHPARQTHRTIDLKLANEGWFMQYSPYMYYNEHTIVIKEMHNPMLVNHQTFERLCDFVDYFPHYFIGSNAGLPIVGGSMLAHDHYQGGHYKMPIVDAKTVEDYGLNIFKNVSVKWIYWPLTTLRLSSEDKVSLVDACSFLNDFWRGYSDEQNGIVAFTDKNHNAITPILRKRGNLYEMDMVLRSNLTSQAHPDGVYHPHKEVHAVKKENIGLIEVMGYAILPGRLKRTIEDLIEGIKNKTPFDALPDSCTGFSEMYARLQSEVPKSEVIRARVQAYIADTFLLGLTHAGVIKDDIVGKRTMETFINALKKGVNQG